jgi:hypothetical protein
LEPDSAKIVRLRGWVAEQITEESPALAHPTSFITKICGHAALLGIVDGLGSVHIQTTGEKRQQGFQGQQGQLQRSMHWNDCDAKCCWSRKRGGRRFCLCLNAKEPMPDDATFGEKQFVSLNRAYRVIQPSANLKKTSVEQMRAAVRKSRKDKPAVLPTTKDAPDLSQAQMKLFTEWLKASAGDEQVTMISTEPFSTEPFEPDPTHVIEGLSMLQPCAFCLQTHTPVNPWCALSIGMPEQSPLPEMSGGCGRSRCDNGFCACDMRAYEKEFLARTLARVGMYNSQLELRDSLMRRAAAELVDRAINIALDAINSDKPCLQSANTPSFAHSVNVGISDTAERLFLDSAARSLTTDAMPDGEPAWPIQQVVTELLHAAQQPAAELTCQQLVGENIFLSGLTERSVLCLKLRRLSLMTPSTRMDY